MQKSNEFGARSARADLIRLIALMVLLVAVFTLEMTVGESARNAAAKKSLEQIDTKNWALARYTDYTNTVPIPKKSTKTQRIAYLSNSHALTGGKVAYHLQSMLNILAPGEYEILDLSSGGIFIPDMLQRAISVLDYDIDALLLGVSYISFSDRMKLSMQSHSARSFLKSDIMRHIKPGFWFRNYEISLYLDTLFAHGLDLYRYRNEIRDLWEKPFGNWLRTRTEPRMIHSIELDAFRSWRFPDGYDRNLFQWRLYRVGRSNHMADLQDLLNVASEHGVEVLTSNLPVDWKKGAYPNDPVDTRKYQRELQQAVSGLGNYHDYENTFPKAFTTYDALHPTWHGARLHALDLILRMRDAELIEISDDMLWQAFTESDTQEYQSITEQKFSPLTAEELQRFRRFDISEKDNAVHLLRRVVSYTPASKEDTGLLWSLAQHLEYRRRVTEQLSLTLSNNADTQIWEGLQLSNYPLWHAAVREELEKSSKNMEAFTQVLKSIQTKRTIKIPDQVSSYVPVRSRSIRVGDLSFTAYDQVFDDGTRLELLKDSQDRAIYVDIFPTTGPAYRRIDLLGDESFISFENPTTNFPFPPWLWSDDSIRRLGI